jgi:hypothetical protein
MAYSNFRSSEPARSDNARSEGASGAAARSRSSLRTTRKLKAGCKAACRRCRSQWLEKMRRTRWQRRRLKRAEPSGHDPANQPGGCSPPDGGATWWGCLAASAGVSPLERLRQQGQQLAVLAAGVAQQHLGDQLSMAHEGRFAGPARQAQAVRIPVLA